MEDLQITKVPITEIKPYKNNPRKNDEAVEVVKNSIQKFGFKNPIILDENNEIVAGHTRVEAGKQLNFNQIPVIYATDLTQEQIKAFRIMDNKSHEYSFWDFDKLQTEFDQLQEKSFDLKYTGFNFEETEGINTKEEEEWVGINEFPTKENVPKIIIAFDTNKDRDKFFENSNLKISKKTKDTWSCYWKDE